MNTDVKILICDDSILARKSLRQVLNDLGFEDVSEVSNGEYAVNFCKDNKPGIVLLDIVKHQR